PADEVLYGFDSNVQGFVPSATQGVTLTRDTSITHAGEGALKVSFDALEDDPETAANESLFELLADSPPIPHNKGVLSAKVFIPETTDIKELGFSVFGVNWTNHSQIWASSRPRGE